MLTVWSVNKWATSTLEIDAVTVEMVSYLVDYVKVIVICYDKEVEERAKRKLLHKGIELSKTDFYIHPIDNQYPRGFGAEVMIDKKVIIN